MSLRDSFIVEAISPSLAEDCHAEKRRLAEARFVRALFDYLFDKAKEQGIDDKPLMKLADEHVQNYGTEHVSRLTPTIKELLTTIKTGHKSIAHPGRIFILALQKDVTAKETMQAIFDNFKAHGGEASEIHYQYVEGTIDDKAQRWLDAIQEYSERIGLLSTGGIDTHSSNIFIRT